MAGKARVHELAKELGVTSKEVLARLSDQGEFVKSASSTVEAPVARRLREAFGGGKPAAADKAPAAGNGSAAGAPAKPAAKAPAKPAAPKPARTCGAGRTRTRTTSGSRSGGAAGSRRTSGAPARRYARSPARSGARCAQARRACAARRQQSFLVPAAGRPADSASAGTPSRCPAARCATTRHVAGQYASASGRCPARSRWRWSPRRTSSRSWRRWAWPRWWRRPSRWSRRRRWWR